MTRLSEITVEGFTSIRSATVELGSLNVLVGANGAGKSNFIRALEMLGYLADGQLGLFVGLAGGASALFHDPPGGADQIVLDLASNEARYIALLRAAPQDSLIFDNEFFGPVVSSTPSPIADLGRGHKESQLAAQVPVPDLADRVSHMLRGCRVYHFHDTSSNAPVKSFGYVSDSESLHPDAGNLAPFLLRMRASDPTDYRRIVTAIRQVAPFFRDFVLAPEAAPDRVKLRWTQEGSETVFPADAFSDGTLRFICLATLLLQPNLPALVVLDEPELGLHPFAIHQLAEMLHLVAEQRQVLLATQSVTLMNQFSLADLIVVEREAGESIFSRPDAAALQDWLDDYGLGELWEKNLLGGRPAPEQA